MKINVELPEGYDYRLEWEVGLFDDWQLVAYAPTGQVAGVANVGALSPENVGQAASRMNYHLLGIGGEF